jgi:hypothetical protein
MFRCTHLALFAYLAADGKGAFALRAAAGLDGLIAAGSLSAPAVLLVSGRVLRQLRVTLRAGVWARAAAVERSCIHV